MVNQNEDSSNTDLFILLWILLCILILSKNKYNFRTTFNGKLKKDNIFIISNHPKIKKFKDIVDFENVDDVYKFFNQVNFNKDLHIIIITEGGESEGADSIAYNLSSMKFNGYKHKINMYIPSYAYSSGSMMMMSGDNIYMNWYSLVSPVDSQLEYELDDNETFSVKHLRKMKVEGEFKNSMAHLIKKDAESIYQSDLYLLNKVLRNNDNKKKIINKMFKTNLSHGVNYNIKDLKSIGLNIITPIPKNINNIVANLCSHI